MGFVEVASALRSRPPIALRALLWWVPRLAIDFVLGVAGLFVILQSTNEAWVHGVGGAVVGALLGPVVARSRLFTFGRDEDAKPVGIAIVYDMLRDYFEGNIDEIGASRDAKWLQDEVIPEIMAGREPARSFGRLLATFVRGRRMLDDQRRRAEEAAVDAALEDRETSDREKVEQLVQQAQELQAFSLMSEIARRGKKRSTSAR